MEDGVDALAQARERCGLAHVAFTDIAAQGLGVTPRDLTVMMIHRPHEDKNYVDQSIYFFFLPEQRYPAADEGGGRDGGDEPAARALTADEAAMAGAFERFLCATRTDPAAPWARARRAQVAFAMLMLGLPMTVRASTTSRPPGHGSKSAAEVRTWIGSS